MIAIRKIIMVGSQDEIFEELPPEGIELYVIQPTSLIGPKLKSAAKALYPIESFTDEQVLEAAHYFTDHYDIDALFSFTEYGLLPAANAAKMLGLPGIDLAVTELCCNKWKLREKLAPTPFHVPFIMAAKTEDICHFAVSNGFPLVLKDPSGVGSINVKICTTLSEALDFFQNLRHQDYTKVLVEKFVDGTEYSVETLSIRGQHHLVGVTDKRFPPGGLLEQSLTYPAALTQDDFERIKCYIVTLLGYIQHYHGPMHIEVKLQCEQIHLIEINNRPGGDYIWDMVNKVSGINLVAETLRYAFDGSPNQQERKRRQRYGSMSHIALFYPILSADITRALATKTCLERVHCKTDVRPSSNKTSNFFERFGFILIGEKNLAALNTVLPTIEEWITSQQDEHERCL